MCTPQSGGRRLISPLLRNLLPLSKIPSRASAANRARLEIRRLLANLRAWLEFAPSRNPDAFLRHFHPTG